MSHANCLDYLERRGLLPLSLSPFCEVDSLILSICAYVDFDGILSGPQEDRFLPLPQVVSARMGQRTWDELGLFLDEDIPYLLQRVAASPRFASFRMGGYQNIRDETTGIQFAAVTFRLPDGTLFAAFRGTDDSLVGWKECFSMSFSAAVPAQRQSETYLADLAAGQSGKLRLGGHSKGGNLAIWAAVHADPLVRDRILRVYNHDGPGFSRDLTRSPAYRALSGRIVTFIPQSSVVGILLHQDSHYQVIHSLGTGTVGQHDPFSWEVDGPRFVYLSRRSAMGRRSAAALQGWIASMNTEEREEFTSVLFDLLASTNAKTLSQLTDSLVDGAFAIVKAYADLDRTTRWEMLRYLRRLLVNLGTGGRTGCSPRLPGRRPILGPHASFIPPKKGEFHEYRRSLRRPGGRTDRRDPRKSPSLSRHRLESQQPEK